MIDYNLILFIGCGLIIFGFSLFLYSEMKERELDIKLFELEHKNKKEKARALKIIYELIIFSEENYETENFKDCWKAYEYIQKQLRIVQV